jgi:CBS domain-containing protein
MEETMMPQGTPEQGFQTVKEIVTTNALCFRADDDGVSAAAALLTAHASGAPVVDQNGVLVGFVSEMDLLRAMDRGEHLDERQVSDLMRRDPISISEDTPLVTASRLLDDYRILVLPVIRNGTVVSSLTRHDLLRARVGIGPEIEE